MSSWHTATSGVQGDSGCTWESRQLPEGKSQEGFTEEAPHVLSLEGREQFSRLRQEKRAFHAGVRCVVLKCLGGLNRAPEHWMGKRMTKSQAGRVSCKHIGVHLGEGTGAS